MKMSRNHVTVEPIGETVECGVSDYLLSVVGVPSRFVFHPPGVRVKAGSPLGRLYGPLQACSVFAPMDCEVKSSDAYLGKVVVIPLNPESDEPLFDEAAYFKHLSRISRKTLDSNAF